MVNHHYSDGRKRNQMVKLFRWNITRINQEYNVTSVRPYHTNVKKNRKSYWINLTMRICLLLKCPKETIIFIKLMNRSSWEHKLWQMNNVDLLLSILQTTVDKWNKWSTDWINTSVLQGAYLEVTLDKKMASSVHVSIVELPLCYLYKRYNNIWLGQVQTTGKGWQ